MAMNLFEELLKEARKRAGLSQQALADKVDVDDSYISKMENRADKPPSRYIAVKLANALGLRKKSRRRLEFLLAAGVTTEEDLEGFALVKIEEDEAEKKGDQTSDTSIPLMAHPVIDTQNLLLGTTGKEIERLLGSARLSEEEEKQIAVEVIEFTKRLLALNEALRALRKSEESR
jgi:transcriptional regulator with XRE-family HTH domain